MYELPYGNTQQLNLDWFIKRWQEFYAQWQEAEAGIDHALDAEIQRVEDAMTDLYAARDAAAASAAAAAASASSASNSATTASNAATAAAASATLANNKATAAGLSEAAAANSANSASNSATAAATSASQANASAASATTDAQSATASATAAGNSATAAAASAQRAEDAAAEMVSIYPTETIENTALAHFTDGAGGLPVVALILNGGNSVKRTGRNVLSARTETFTIYKTVDIDPIPAGTWRFSAIVTSSDIDGTTSAIVFQDENGNTLASKFLTRNSRDYSSVFTVSVPIAKIVIYAGGSYPSSVGDTATFADMMIEYGTAMHDFEEYTADIFTTPSDTTTLNGINNIWPDSGTITKLTYRSSLSAYNALIAKTETSYTATQAYSVNDFVIVDNTLYIVTANIANGGTITPNTNVTATTVTAQITALLNA